MPRVRQGQLLPWPGRLSVAEDGRRPLFCALNTEVLEVTPLE